MANPIKLRKLIKMLQAFDARFELYTDGGKGSHRQIFHPDINGHKRSFPVKYHGRNTEIRPGMVSAIIRRFELPDDLL